jgi:FHA domain
MSFRWFIYYCALCGGCAAYLGWALGKLAHVEEQRVVEAGVKGMCLGVLLACSLGLIDALWDYSPSRVIQIGLRVVVAMLIGGFGGFFGGVVGQALYGVSLYSGFDMPALLILGWALTGLLIGMAPGLFDLMTRAMLNQDTRGARRKIMNGVLGGSVGGVLGGSLFLLMQFGWAQAFHVPAEGFWSPVAAGFVVLGLCIGLLIGLAQVIFKEAWVRVEKGFRPGRELILSRPAITIGRSESCDLGLFGDPALERLHARIVREGNGYVLLDENTPGGTFLNGERINGPAPLYSGDLIQVGNSLLRFGERQKR